MRTAHLATFGSGSKVGAASMAGGAIAGIAMLLGCVTTHALPADQLPAALASVLS